MDNIKDVVNSVIDTLSSGGSNSQDKIYSVWNDITTPKEKEHSKMIGVKNKKVYIDIDSPTWLYHFKSQKNKILERIKESVVDINYVIFRIGNIK